MRWHRILTAIAAFGALLTGLLLIPRNEEHVTMLVRDGRYEEASRLLLRMRESGDERPQLLMQLATLELKRGEVDGALRAIETYLVAIPDDAGALEMYAELLLDSGRLNEFLQASDRLVRIRPDMERLSRLVALYKLNGRTAEEKALLQAFAGTRYIKLAQLERLGALTAAEGDWVGAARWLRIVDSRAPAGESQARLRLLHALLQSGQPDEARRLAERWLVAWRSPYLTGKLVRSFAEGGALAEARTLARMSVERLPEATFQIAGVLTQYGHAWAAREMLAHWGERVVSPAAQEVRDYVHASLAAGEVQRPLQKLLKLLQDTKRPEVLASFVEEIAYGYGAQVVASLLPVLPRNVLLARPLLAAELARAAGNNQLASWFLDRVDVGELAAQQHDLWLAMMRELLPRQIFVERLVALVGSGRLPQAYMEVIASEVRDVGHGILHDALWASWRR